MQNLPFASYRRGGTASVQRLVNCCAEQLPINAKSPASVIRSPGIRSHKNVGSGPGRGLGEYAGKLYAVSGTKLYEVPKLGGAGNATQRGTIAGSTRVSMESNSIVLGIVAEPNLYTLDAANTLTQIADTDFTSRGAKKIGFIDGYFIFFEPGSGRHFSSDLYATTFDALKFATAEQKPDKIVDQLVNVRQVSFFGEKSVERWYNAGADNYPFEKMSGGDIGIGCLGGVALQDNAEHWLANDTTYRRMEGQTGRRVSQHGVEEAWQKYTPEQKKAAYGFPIAMEGHLFVVVNFPELATWVLDCTTGEWHERASLGRNDWRVCDAIELDGVWYVQDEETGKVGILDPDVYDEWGATLRAELTFPAPYNNGGVLFHNAFELIFEYGVGLPSGQGQDPQLMLEFSDDGGKTWWFAPSRSLGKQGEYKWRAMWHSLGAARDRVYRVAVSDPVRFTLISARYAVEPGDD